jgi:hypothetical protein
VVAVSAAGAAAMLLLTVQPSANAEPVAAEPVIGSATYFDGLGEPFGGCGMPQSELETQDFVALNVYDTPGDYNFYPRPLVGADVDKIGQWNNGLNCGRWVRVTVGDFCTGVNDGAPGQAFCRGGAWTDDGYRGGVLDMLVADSCGDSNGWCRDDPYHLDLSKASLNRFVRDGATVTDMFPNHWNNRHVEWSFIPAPNYSGDIQIGFVRGAEAYWPAIAVSHLANGIHGVEFFANGAWRPATMNSDMGQSYIIGGITAGATQFQIRVRDAADTLINGGRVYSFSLPAACGTKCGAAYTRTTYTTSGPTTPSSATPSSSVPSSSVPSSSVPSSSVPSSPVPPSSAPPAARGCTAVTTVTSSWQGGFQATVTITAGTAPIGGWAATWTLPAGTNLNQAWNGTLSASGSSVTVRNASYNGSLGAGASTSFGYTATGPAGAPAVSCAAA